MLVHHNSKVVPIHTLYFSKLDPIQDRILIQDHYTFQIVFDLFKSNLALIVTFQMIG